MRLTVGAVVDQAVRTRPHGLAASLGERSVTFTELDRAATRTAAALQGLGVSSGDVVALWAAPSLRTLDLFVAAARLGLVFAPVNPSLSPAELDQAVGYLGARLLVADADRAEIAAEAARGHGARSAAFGGRRGPHPGADLDALTARTSAYRVDVEVDDTAPHIVYLTSGSTGRPKGVVVSHRASWLRSSAGGGTFSTGIRGFGGLVCSFPLYHYGGWHYVLEAWHHRTAAHLVARADAEQLVAAVSRWHASALYCIPPVWERVLADEHRAADLSSLQHADIGTSRVAPELMQRLRTRLPHATTTVLYGSTEAGRMAALPHADVDRKPGSVGLPASPGALWLADDGEVCFATPAMMDGYLGLPEQTAAVLRDGVYHSGDLGELDDDGYLYLTGRTREVIRTGGEWVAPAEVEHALHDLPGVRDVAVVGVPDDRWGEVVCALLVMTDGVPLPTTDQVRAHVRDRLAPHKHPRRVVAVETVPRTPATGQVQRGALRAALLGDVS